MRCSLLVLSIGMLLSPPLLQAADPSNRCDGTNFDRVLLRSGCSTICYEEPCEVYFLLPRSGGSFTLESDGMPLGAYQAGKRHYLGHYWRGMHEFRLPGTRYPPAYLHVGGAMLRD
jgi:hypothetical protein